jgi:alanyl-tRNA synthetase
MTKVRAEELPDRIGKMMAKLKQAEKEISKARTSALTNNISELVGQPEKIGETSLYRFIAPAGTAAGELRELVTSAKGNITSNNFVLVGATEAQETVAFVVTTDSAARESGISAAEVLKAMMPLVDGRGGGSAEMSQGGGSKIEALNEALIAAATGLGK